MPIEQPLKLQLDYPETVFDQPSTEVSSSDIYSYDTILFDLDNTIWDVLPATREGPTRAGDTKAPYRMVEDGVVLDREDTSIVLHLGIREFITLLVEQGIKLGVVSTSKSHTSNVEPDTLPAFTLLQEFGLAGYFDAGIVIEHDSIPKSRLVNRVVEGKTLLIDDTASVLEDVEEESNVDVLPRQAFGDYYDLFTNLTDGLSRVFVITLALVGGKDGIRT